MRFVGWLLGLDSTTSIDDVRLAFAASWVEGNERWLALLCGLAAIGAIAFYYRFQPAGKRLRALLGLVRATLLVLLVLTLAAPVLRMTVTSTHPATVLIALDGTDSMAIEDPWTTEQRSELMSAIAPKGEEGVGQTIEPESRADFLRAFLRKDENNLVEQLREKNVHLEAFVFEGQSTSRLRRLEQDNSGKSLGGQWSEQITTKGQVTSLSSVFEDIRKQPGLSYLAGIVLFSDFANNSGSSPVAGGDQSPARQTGVPVHTVGLGAIETLDLAIDLQTDPRMKKAERTVINVRVRQSGLSGEQAKVRVVARPMSGESTDAGEHPVGEALVELASPVESIEFAYTPAESGLVEFLATVEPLPAEAEQQNNRASRQVNVIDDYLRLLYVASEPDWEWRFVKEVFHRDPLVGLEGFRTFLSSSDPRVRDTNPLFLQTLTPKRADFFSNDVLFLGDMPQSAVSGRFGELVKEFVGSLGGGLVVLSGPRFGPQELAETPLGEMLPVVVDPDARLRDERPFRIVRTSESSLYPFMKLGDSPEENEKAWDNLGEIPWYQPISSIHPQSTVLAEHPTDKCLDGQTPQPLIAVRNFGKGEVVYLAFNEVWRLRRRYGEQYYRQFWSQLIYRLGMSHALGHAKRFVPRLDKTQYRVEDEVQFSVEAYNEHYEPLRRENLVEGNLVADLVGPPDASGRNSQQRLEMQFVREGHFESKFPVYLAGDYTVRLEDPITGQIEERRFTVSDSSAERRRIVRDRALQEEIAKQTGGRSYDLTTAAQLVNELSFQPHVERTVRNHPLWSTPIWFGLIAGLMLCEWLVRKWMYLH